LPICHACPAFKKSGSICCPEYPEQPQWARSHHHCIVHENRE
jgi:hypothetical protein